MYKPYRIQETFLIIRSLKRFFFVSEKAVLNPLMPNEISRPYHLDESISNLRVVRGGGGEFQFHSNFKSTFCKQTVQNLIR